MGSSLTFLGAAGEGQDVAGGVGLEDDGGFVKDAVGAVA